MALRRLALARPKGSIMNLVRRRFLQLAGVAAAAPVLAPLAAAQTYPAGPVRVIVPFAPGGPTDLFARPISEKLSQHLNKQFYVENIAGAGGNIGVGQAARAAPDGQTILFVPSAFATNPSLYDKVPYDPHRDFDPVTLAVFAPTALFVNPSLPIYTVKDLVAQIKASPSKYSYASPGTGTAPHLVGELFRLSLGLDLVHVPFNGGGPAVASTLAGHTPIGWGAVPPAMEHIRQGALRALAMATSARSQALPDVPTMAEAGYPDMEADSWWAVLVPAGTPKDVIKLLHSEIVGIMAEPEMKENMAKLGYEPIGSTPDECAAKITAAVAKWGKVIREANIKAR
jgi:tripartite-type tricarboxylate transporter receptor subunit TctC